MTGNEGAVIMHGSSRFVRSLCVAAVAICAGCSAGQSMQPGSTVPSTSSMAERAARAQVLMGVPQPAHRGGGWLSPAAKSGKGLIYVSDFSANTVQIYPTVGSNPAPIGEITDGLSGPEGNFVDKDGNLFVSNVTNYTVTMYPKGSTTWKLRYTGLTYPTNVTVGKNGVVYIADLVGDKVVEYRKGSTRSLRTIAVKDPQGVALDAHDNLYVSYDDSTGGQVNEYAPGSTMGTNLGISLQFAGGDATDGRNDLLAADQSAPAVFVYPPGSNTPSQTINQGLEDPFRIAINRAFKKLYVADPEANALFVYDYPSGTLVNTITTGLKSVYGVAVTPEGN
jgi:hypothetical protein